jgi:hypothetical protein
MAREIQQLRETHDVAALSLHAEGVLVVDTEFYAIRVHDGVTDGGNPTLMVKANLADLDNAALARENLGLGSAALLEADGAFMLGENNLIEITDSQTSRTNINAAKSGDNDDLLSLKLRYDGLTIMQENRDWKVQFIWTPVHYTADHSIILKAPDADIVFEFTGDASIKGTNTGDQSLIGAILGSNVVDTTTIDTTIAAKAIVEEAFDDEAVSTRAIAAGAVTGSKLEAVPGLVAGTYALPTIEIDVHGRVIEINGGVSGASSGKAKSGELALTNGVTFAHGLDDIPDFVQAQLVCAIADGAFVAGDRVVVSTESGGLSSMRGYTLSVSDTECKMFVDDGSGGADAAGFNLVNHDGDIQICDPANWNVVFIALLIP